MRDLRTGNETNSKAQFTCFLVAAELNLENMSNLPHVNRYHDLRVYALARKLSFTIFTLSKSFPKEEMYSMTDQIRRSSRSIGAQIAEAWAKRKYEKHFVSKLTDADGEQQETQHWLEVAFDCNYIKEDEMRVLIGICNEIGRMLNSMISKSDLFCGDTKHSINELPTEYYLDDPASEYGG